MPTSALLEGNRVLVPDDWACSRSVAVEIGLKNWDYAEVTQRLSTRGERVVISLDRVGGQGGCARGGGGDRLPSMIQLEHVSRIYD